MACKKPYSELTRSGKYRRLLKQKTAGGHSSKDDCDLDRLTVLNFQNDDSGKNNSHQDFSTIGSSQNSTDNDISNLDFNDSQYAELWDEKPSESESEDEEDIFENGSKSEKLQEELKNWAFQFHVANIAVSALLLILRKNGVVKDLSMPLDARTLLRTPSTINTINVAPGIYHHLGFEQGLNRIWHKVTEAVSTIQVLIGIDGLPLFRSSNGELWPILVSILNIPSISTDVFPVGIYYGVKKPSRCMDFLKPFIDEMNSLIEEGIVVKGKKILVSLKGFCCDTPAKAFILGTKGHTGYSSCTKCKQEGHYTNHRLIFPDIPDRESLQCRLRTSTGFRRQEDREHHNYESPLTAIPTLDFISAFPLDYMHLVCLGVMRTLMYIWIFAVPHKLPQRLVDDISSKLVHLQRYIPSEFCRKPRRLDDIKRWKATEFRQLLLYTGPVVLKNILPPQLYTNFLELHIAIRILTDPKHCMIHRIYAQDLLIHFLHSFKSLYGQQYMTHNFHGLLHISDSIATFGPLDKSSAFKFENYLFSMKKLIRKGDKPLQQVVKRLVEQSSFSPPSPKQNYPFCCSPDSTSNHFKKIEFQDFFLSNTLSNSCCKLSDQSIVIIKYIKQFEDSTPLIIVQKFINSEDFFGSPLCQSSSIGIHIVSNLLQTEQEVLANEVVEKMVLLPLNEEKYLVVPLLHRE